jgi:hypothetical protein
MNSFGVRSGSLSAKVGVSATTPTMVSHCLAGLPGMVAMIDRVGCSLSLQHRYGIDRYRPERRD